MSKQKIDSAGPVPGAGIPAPVGNAADGGPVPGACNTLGEFVTSLEDGQFSADAYGAVQELAAKLHEHAWHNGGKAKGSLSITIDFTQEGGITEIKASYKIKAPQERRAKSVMWLTDDNRFTRTNPRQHQLFGIRDVSGSAGLRSAE